MTNRPQQVNGTYTVHGKKYNNLVGSRKQVWRGFAYKTAGGLTKDKLFYNTSTRRIVSLVKHFTAKKEQRLLKHGYGTKKGKFGFVKVSTRKNRKMKKGGDGAGVPDLSGVPSVDIALSETTALPPKTEVPAVSTSEVPVVTAGKSKRHSRKSSH